MCDTLTSLRLAALPVFCTLATPWSVQSFHCSLEHLRRSTSKSRRRQRTMRDSGTESESTFTSYLSMLESKLSLSLHFTCTWMANMVKRQSFLVKSSNCSVGSWDRSCRGDMFSTGDFRTKHHCASTTHVRFQQALQALHSSIPLNERTWLLWNDGMIPLERMQTCCYLNFAVELVSFQQQQTGCCSSYTHTNTHLIWKDLKYTV